MSASPNRAAWLARRATPHRLPTRLLWHSGVQGTYVRKHGDGRDDWRAAFQRTCNGNRARRVGR